MNNQSKFKCRFCDHDLDKLIVSLPSMPLTDDFVNLHSLDRKEFLENINIFQCGFCCKSLYRGFSLLSFNPVPQGLSFK